MSTKAPVIMLDLEEKLLTDSDGSQRAKLIVDLRAIQLRLHGELRQMNSRTRYQQLQGAMQAVTAAVQVLQTLKIPEASAGKIKLKSNE